MAPEDDFSNENSATLNKWRRRLEHAEMAHDAAVSGMKKFLKKAKSEESTNKNLAKEILGIMRGKKVSEYEGNEAGFDNNKEGPVTGFEILPWKEDD